MTVRPFKIKVESESHSREIQEWLFSLGYHWWNTFGESIQEVKNLEYQYLYFNQALKENTPTLSVTSSPGFFDILDIPEAWFYDGKLQDKPQIQPQTNPRIRTYRQVAEALLEGTKLQFLDHSGGWIPINYAGLHVHQLDREYPYEVRETPRICNGVELDPCLTEHPKLGTYYYFPDPTRVGYYYNRTLWGGDSPDRYWFDRGFVYATAEAASKHGRAMGLYMDITSSTNTKE